MEKIIDHDLGVEVPEACGCGCEHFIFIGVQEGKDCDLSLFNCVGCSTTISTYKEKERAA